ncbi:MAG TPA: CO dehydrogenase/CO-methylating acetyl-CoA synthase complex subunit beta [Dehalococcoidia bacterium]|nr:CO dehydrogenase/CO-methylating acetyl-CoA synthase complex subunit beta [Dehalococcoidia bacterium]
MFPVDVGPQYEGEVIRKADLYVEFGGPNVKSKFELVTLRGADEVEDQKIETIGPDIKDMKEGGSYPLALMIDVAGEKLEKDMEPVLERRIHLYTNYIEGLYHMNQRQDIWIRLNKDSFNKGLNSLEEIGKILIFLYTSEIDIIEKIAITFVTDEKKVEELLADAVKIYDERDEKARGLKEEDVEEFYSCALCQSFAPTHICAITPERIANCGAINWFDGKAAYKLDPEGPVQEVKKGDLLDPIRGEYTGTNQLAAEKSMGAYTRVYLHSAFEYPHTSCGCFQAIWFYIPEVDAFGLVHRDFAGPTVVGVPFSTMAADTSGGRQVEGFLGLALEYLRSPKFLQADGGLKRCVWMPKEIKERYKDAIPPDLYDKIATEEDVQNVDELVEFLDRVEHPWVKGEVELPI